MLKIAFGIQVRLGSTRLVEKSIKKIGSLTLVEHLLENVFQSIEFFYRRNREDKVFGVYLLVPESEGEFWIDFQYKAKENFELVFGPMDNVFERYLSLVSKAAPDYVVRLTGDCPFIPTPLITKTINLGCRHRYDYTTNTFEEYRTMPDGYDVEMLSHKALIWLARNRRDMTPEDTEHVTTYLKRNHQRAGWMKCGAISGTLDHSKVKLSVDTLEDFENVKRLHDSKVQKDLLAEERGLRVFQY